MRIKKDPERRSFLIAFLLLVIILLIIFVVMISCSDKKSSFTEPYTEISSIHVSLSESATESVALSTEPETEELADITEPIEETTQETQKEMQKTSEPVIWDSSWKYAENSAIHTDSAMLYYASPEYAVGKTVCVNAGHGTAGGSSVKTLCHPDGTPKVTSGSTEKGATKATAVAYGTTMNDGVPEAEITLRLALVLKEKLLQAGFDVLMIREDDDVQLDNIARTVMANEHADCHIALHYDSTQSDKGAFYMSVPNIASYRAMEPVASIWREHERLGESLISGLKESGVKIFGSGSMAMDLTQTSYSTIPSIDLEVGDRASDYSAGSLSKLADGIVSGICLYYE